MMNPPDVPGSPHSAGAPVGSPAAASAAPEDRDYRLAFEGSGGEYFFIFLKHVFLTLITFGIYFAWAKTERRAYIWKGFSFFNHPFRYTGTGIELLKGYVLVSIGYIIFLGIPALIATVAPELAAMVEIALFLALFAVSPYVIYRSRNFLYSRTTWRSIRFGLDRDSAPYVRVFFIGLVITIVTLGLYAPIYTNRLHSALMNNTRFGSLAFHYDGDDKEVWFLTVKGWLLTFITFGIYYFWYRAELERYRAAHTRIGDTAQLVSTATGVQLLILYLLNVFGTTMTLGLAFPWILMYTLEDLAGRYSVTGYIDFDDVMQRAEDESAISEGLADALDLDLGF